MTTGQDTSCRAAAPLHASITIHDRATFLRLVIKPDLAFGEAYMDGRISTGNGGIDALMELLMLNSRHWSRHWAGRLTLRFGNCLAWLRHLNPRWRSRRNVAHHYDLTDELFETFLTRVANIPAPISTALTTVSRRLRKPSWRGLPPS